MSNVTESLVLMKLVPLCSTIAKGEAAFRGVVQGDRVITLDGTAEQLALISSYDRDTIKGVLALFASRLPTLMAQDGGCPRQLGDLGVIRPYCSGAFSTADAKFDATKNAILLGFQFTRKFREALNGLPVRNVTTGIGAYIASVYDLATQAVNEIHGKDTLAISGDLLAVNTANIDEGLFLYDATGKTRVATFSLGENTIGSLRANLPEVPAIGTYQLRLCTRGGQSKEKYALVTITREVKITA